MGDPNTRLNIHRIFTDGFMKLREVEGTQGVEQKLDKLAFALRDIAWGLREFHEYVSLELLSIQLQLEQRDRRR